MAGVDADERPGLVASFQEETFERLRLTVARVEEEHDRGDVLHEISAITLSLDDHQRRPLTRPKHPERDHPEAVSPPHLRNGAAEGGDRWVGKVLEKRVKSIGEPVNCTADAPSEKWCASRIAELVAKRSPDQGKLPLGQPEGAAIPRHLPRYRGTRDSRCVDVGPDGIGRRPRRPEEASYLGVRRRRSDSDATDEPPIAEAGEYTIRNRLGRGACAPRG
jgi:hypothetical protein